MKLKPPELRFLLLLLGLPNYCGPMTKLTPGKSKGAAGERDRICQDLCSRGVVAYRSEIKRFAIAPPGKALLKLDLRELPISVQDLKVLQRCQTRITPGQLKSDVAKEDRQRVIHSLEERGLVTVSGAVLKEAWLTAQGATQLRNELEVSGPATVSLNLFGNYLRFLQQPAPLFQPSQSVEAGPEAQALDSQAPNSQAGSAEVLQAIARLDAQHDTDNYLPLYLLREALLLGREALDSILYDLQRQDQIELDTVQEVASYSSQQLAAGIPQAVGGALFFISLSD